MTVAEKQMELIEQLTKDLRSAAITLRDEEVRYLVDLYYQMQGVRIAAGNQISAIMKSDTPEPNNVLGWCVDSFKRLEGNIKKALDAYTDHNPATIWAKSICGIGPVISAGLCAHIDITKAPTAGHIWSFAGLNPNQVWEKGQKRPWNADLKTLCWKLGESFVKVSSNDKDVYGKLWRLRKDEEITKNLNGDFKDQAEQILAKKKIGKTTDAYKAYSKGVLPDGHIHARAKRWAVKLFLAHLHHVMYELHYKKEPPKPYIFEHQEGHVHYIGPPNWPIDKALN